MMEAIRDIDNHMVCCVDSTRGLIEHIYQKEMVRISLPVGGEVLFVRRLKGCLMPWAVKYPR